LRRQHGIGRRCNAAIVLVVVLWLPQPFGLGFALRLPCLLALSEASGPTVQRPGTSTAAIYLLVHISLFFYLQASPSLSSGSLFSTLPCSLDPQFLRTAPSTRKGSGSVQRNKFSSTWADLSSAPGFDCIHTFKVFVNQENIFDAYNYNMTFDEVYFVIDQF
jgi:hypothetical protein